MVSHTYYNKSSRNANIDKTNTKHICNAMMSWLHTRPRSCSTTFSKCYFIKCTKHCHGHLCLLLHCLFFCSLCDVFLTQTYLCFESAHCASPRTLTSSLLIRIHVPSYFPQLTLHSSYLRHQMLELWVTLHPCSSSKVNKSNETQVQTNTIRCLHCMASYCDVRYTFSVTVLMSVKPQQLLEELFSC